MGSESSVNVFQVCFMSEMSWKIIIVKNAPEVS